MVPGAAAAAPAPSVPGALSFIQISVKADLRRVRLTHRRDDEGRAVEPATGHLEDMIGELVLELRPEKYGGRNAA